MNLVLGLLVLGGSAAAVWAGITDPEGGLWAGLRNVVQATPNTKHVSATSAAFISDLAAVIPATATGTDGGGVSGGAAGKSYATTTAGPVTDVPGSSAADFNHALAGIVAGGADKRAGIIATARTWLGTPYRWGGTTRKGVDCSGFVQNVYAAHGVSLPRVSAAQATKGRPVSAKAAQPADLVFFGAPVHHVGIVLGGGNMIHAPYPGKVVRVERIAGAVKGAPIRYRNVLG